jgi:hypothetical protein
MPLPILNPEIQTAEATKLHDHQAAPKRFALIHQMSQAMVIVAFSFLLFVTFVVSPFSLKA